MIYSETSTQAEIVPEVNEHLVNLLCVKREV